MRKPTDVRPIRPPRWAALALCGGMPLLLVGFAIGSKNLAVSVPLTIGGGLLLVAGLYPLWRLWRR